MANNNADNDTTDPCPRAWDDQGERLRQCGVTPNKEVEMSLMPTILSLCGGFGERLWACLIENQLTFINIRLKSL